MLLSTLFYFELITFYWFVVYLEPNYALDLSLSSSSSLFFLILSFRVVSILPFVLSFLVKFVLHFWWVGLVLVMGVGMGQWVYFNFAMFGLHLSRSLLLELVRLGAVKFMKTRLLSLRLGLSVRLRTLGEYQTP